MPNKLPLSTLKDRLRWIQTNLEKSKPDWRGDFRFDIPFASFSDYSGCMVERANSRALSERFSFVGIQYGGYGTEWTCIHKEHVLDAIFSDDFPEFQEALDSLHDYPVLDEDLLSQMEMEAENEAWKDWIYSNLSNEIESAHRGQWEINFETGSIPEITSDLETALDAVSEKDFLTLFRDLCESSGRYPEIETGGNAWIDLEKLVENLSYKTLLEVISGVYSITPNVIQIPFNFKGEG